LSPARSNSSRQRAELRQTAIIPAAYAAILPYGLRAYADYPMILPMLRHLTAALLMAPVVLALAGEPARAQPPAPYDGNLQRLAEIMGALHYLRGLCGANDGQKWRTEVQALIEAEAPTGERRTRMIASFNRGYRGFQQSYRTCTPAADIVIRRYLEEGSRIAREVTARYGN
jgi:uncharacterized protein (TIGR02301 family)